MSDLLNLVVTFDANAAQRKTIDSVVGKAARVDYLVSSHDRTALLADADLLFSRNPSVELRPDEFGLLRRVKLIQLASAGVDFIPLREMPREILVAANRGGYSEPIAEHAIAMALAASKSLVGNHDKLRRGVFSQNTENKMLAGGVCGILGFGGIGVASARLARGLGMKVHAVNRSGRTGESCDRILPLTELDELLGATDVLIVSLALTTDTEGLIGARELSLMKRDAILVNVARGEIIDEASLVAHLKATPTFKACIDAWWVEPTRHGRFEADPELLALPNLLGSPHNSATVTGWRDEEGLRRALENCLRVCRGEAPHNLVEESERLR